MAKDPVSRFEQVILPHLDDAYTLARYLLRDEHDAQDVVQDAALRAFRHFDGFRDGDPRAWFMTIVRNCCMSWRRKHRLDRVTVPYSVEHQPMAASARATGAAGATDAAAIEQSDRMAVERLVATLPVEFREVIVLRELQGLSYAQISAVTGAPIGTVMSRLARARQRLSAVVGGAREVG